MDVAATVVIFIFCSLLVLLLAFLRVDGENGELRRIISELGTNDAQGIKCWCTQGGEYEHDEFCKHVKSVVGAEHYYSTPNHFHL